MFICISPNCPKTIPNRVLSEIELHLIEIIFKKIPNFVLAKIQLHLIGIILRQFRIFSKPKFNCTSSKLFYDNSKLCLSRNSIASHRNYSKTIPSCYLAEIQLPLIDIILRKFQIVSYPKFNCTSSKLF